LVPINERQNTATLTDAEAMGVCQYFTKALISNLVYKLQISALRPFSLKDSISFILKLTKNARSLTSCIFFAILPIIIAYHIIL